MIKRIITYLFRYYKVKTNPIGYARGLGVKIGLKTRILDMQLGTFGSEPYLVQLGNNVEITSGVKFITHDGGVWVGRDEEPDIDIIAPIKVGNNVFIGINSIILAGVTIGDNVVIGAGSVVTKDVQSGVVAAGAPAKPIKSTCEYLDEARERSLSTRLMTAEEKKNYLLYHFKAFLS